MSCYWWNAMRRWGVCVGGRCGSWVVTVRGSGVGGGAAPQWHAVKGQLHGCPNLGKIWLDVRSVLPRLPPNAFDHDAGFPCKIHGISSFLSLQTHGNGCFHLQTMVFMSSLLFSERKPYISSSSALMFFQINMILNYGKMFCKAKLSLLSYEI